MLLGWAFAVDLESIFDSRSRNAPSCQTGSLVQIPRLPAGAERDPGHDQGDDILFPSTWTSLLQQTSKSIQQPKADIIAAAAFWMAADQATSPNHTDFR